MLSFERTTRSISRPPFVVDQCSIVRDNGRQIDWDLIGNTFVDFGETVKLNGAAVFGAVSLTVDPLPVDLEVGDLLDFGTLEQVTVTVGASALAAAVSLTVSALSGPIPDNTLLDFGSNKFARLNGNAAAGATSIVVDAVPTAFAGGEVATFQGGVKAAIVDAHADAGATTVVVEDLPFDLADDSEATVPGEELPGGVTITAKHIPAGTAMDLLASGKIVPSSLGSAAVSAYGLLLTNADEDSRTDAITGYGVIIQGTIYENLLPEADGNTPSVIPSAFKTELLARGGAWMFLQYEDDSAS